MVARHRYVLLFITVTAIAFIFFANWLVTAGGPEPTEQRALVTPASGEPQLRPIPHSRARQSAHPIDNSSRQADGSVRMASHSAAAAVAMASVAQPGTPKIRVTRIEDGDYDWKDIRPNAKIYLIEEEAPTLHFEGLDGKAFNVYVNGNLVLKDEETPEVSLADSLQPGVEANIAVEIARDGAGPTETLITLVLPSNGSIAKPRITEFATNEFAEPKDDSTAFLFGDRPYLRLRGRDKPVNAEFRFFQTKVIGGRHEIRELPSQPNISAMTNIPGAWQTQVTLDLPTSDYQPSTQRTHRLFVRSRQEGQHVYSVPLEFRKHEIARASKPVLEILPDGLELYEGAYRVNRPNWQVQVTLAGTLPASGLVVIRNPQKRDPLRVVSFNTSPADIEVTDLSLGSQQLIAEIWQGNVLLTDANHVRAVSDPIRVHLQTQGPRVERVEPKNFGTAPGVRTLSISFTHENPLNLPTNETEAETKLEDAIELRASEADGTFAFSTAVPKDQFATRFNPQTNTVSLRFTTLQAAQYQLTIRGSQLTDIYDNEFEGQEGQPGTNYVEVLGQQAALAGMVTTEPSVRPGISGATGPYVQYPEFTEPRSVPDGFNPHDKVETRVARLYYYRDAHRVAQIINRRVKSYNRQGVDMERQLADKARNLADQTTAARQAAERKAIDRAEATRRAENELESAQRALEQTLTELTTAQRRGEPNQIVQSLDSAAQRFVGQVESLQDQVEHAREREIEATEDAERLESDERLARAEQFRREVAATHADPDTYAPGRPKSRDPVEQVSVSVIGEGLIHLRGPIKGINTIRTMIDQIDSPLGQTRISVHTVQINGEDQSRMEDVANIAQLYIDQARFLTLQSSEMLRRAVVQVAARKAEEARHLYPGESQEARDQRYLHAFFGRDFINELIAIDSEFLQTGNKLLSLHSMDTTSLSSALNLMALAKNSVREEILAEFDIMVQTELPAAEAHNLEAGLTAGKKSKFDLRHPPKFYPLAQRAQFQSLRAFFNAEIIHDDTMTPLQREFIRLAQIFKSRLITEIEYKQRVMERAVIEERLGDRIWELKDAKRKEDDAQRELAEVQRERADSRQQVVVTLTQAAGILLANAEMVRENFLHLEEGFGSLATQLRDIDSSQNIEAHAAITNRGDLLYDVPWILTETVVADKPYNLIKDEDGEVRIIGQDRNTHEEVRENTRFFKELFVNGVRMAERMHKTLAWYSYRDHPEKLEKASEKLHQLIEYANQIESGSEVRGLRLEDARSAGRLLVEDLEPLYNELVSKREDFQRRFQVLLVSLRENSELNMEMQLQWTRLHSDVTEFFREHPQSSEVRKAIDGVNSRFNALLAAQIKHEASERLAQSARRPLDHKKFLDMLIDQLEEKYIELLEGTRAHTANVDNYLKRLTTALDDDFNTQFYNPTFRYVRETSTYWDVEFGQTETTTILTNNRQLAKVSPSATMEFDLPKRDILINEALDGAMANVQDFGALLNDPTFLAAAQLESPNSTATPPAGTTSGFGVVRDVLPGLSTSTSEDILAQNADGRPQFGSNLENLIPDPAIYKFETGTGFEIRPVIQPDGQAVVFDFNYMYTTNIREPVRADEKHLGRVKRHYIDTDVQLSNFELREVSRYTVALKAARTSQGVPLLQDIPLIGALCRPLPSQESSLQQNVILAQATIFPTLFDLMGLRWAPAVDDLDPLRLSNQEFIARGRHRELQNRVYDHSSTKVDEFLRIPEPTRRADLYRTQESVPRMHPNGYQGPGLDLQDSQLQEGYQPERAFPEQNYIPSESKEGAPFLPGRRHGHAPGTYIDDYPVEMVAPGEPDPKPVVEPLPHPVVDPVNYLER